MNNNNTPPSIMRGQRKPTPPSQSGSYPTAQWDARVPYYGPHPMPGPYTVAQQYWQHLYSYQHLQQQRFQISQQQQYKKYETKGAKLIKSFWFPNSFNEDICLQVAKLTPSDPLCKEAVEYVMNVGSKGVRDQLQNRAAGTITGVALIDSLYIDQIWTSTEFDKWMTKVYKAVVRYFTLQRFPPQRVKSLWNEVLKKSITTRCLMYLAGNKTFSDAKIIRLVWNSLDFRSFLLKSGKNAIAISFLLSKMIDDSVLKERLEVALLAAMKRWEHDYLMPGNRCGNRFFVTLADCSAWEKNETGTLLRQTDLLRQPEILPHQTQNEMVTAKSKAPMNAPTKTSAEKSLEEETHEKNSSADTKDCSEPRRKRTTKPVQQKIKEQPTSNEADESSKSPPRKKQARNFHEKTIDEAPEPVLSASKLVSFRADPVASAEESLPESLQANASEETRASRRTTKPGRRPTSSDWEHSKASLSLEEPLKPFHTEINEKGERIDYYYI
jgi:hypothetical protein